MTHYSDASKLGKNCVCVGSCMAVTMIVLDALLPLGMVLYMGLSTCLSAITRFANWLMGLQVLNLIIIYI
jgi:hypothetical protein